MSRSPAQAMMNFDSTPAIPDGTSYPTFQVCSCSEDSGPLFDLSQ